MNANEIAAVCGIDVKGPKKNADGTFDASLMALRLSRYAGASGLQRFQVFAALSGLTVAGVEEGATFLWAFFQTDAFVKVNVSLPTLPESSKSAALLAKEAAKPSPLHAVEMGEDDHDEDCEDDEDGEGDEAEL